MSIQQDILALPCIRQYAGFITIPQTVLLFSTGKEKNKEHWMFMQILHENLNSMKIYNCGLSDGKGTTKLLLCIMIYFSFLILMAWL